MSASTAAVHLARKEPWKSLLSTHRGSASDALRKQYEAADPRWTKVYRNSLAYEEYLAKIDEGKTEDEAFAAAELLPAQVTPLMDELARQSAEVKAGVQRGEAMMANHASVLDALFNTLTRRAMANADAGNIDALDTYLRLAFKAQSQCRNTWESIAEIRKPRSVAFVKQANIAAGHQQVNNVRAREKQKAPNELNEVAHERTVDRGGKAPAIGADTSVATLGALDGAANARGQGKVRMQQLSGRGAIPAPRTGKTAKG